ncbi:hypothetical protein COP1_013511 [Malus domestica]
MGGCLKHKTQPKGRYEVDFRSHGWRKNPQPQLGFGFGLKGGHRSRPIRGWPRGFCAGKPSRKAGVGLLQTMTQGKKTQPVGWRVCTGQGPSKQGLPWVWSGSRKVAGFPQRKN